mmetsp:Transcript_7508/g.9030  ORF Transcript_7508/g.9030 Transcript_7508/m.9030 type:complete len:138 (-) Transcript_7508:573-986(-)
MWLSFGSLVNGGDHSLCNETRKQKSGSEYYYDWNAIVSQLYALHKEVEVSNWSSFFVYNFTKRSKLACKDYRLCPGPSGVRKLATRTSIEPLAVRIHDIGSSAAIKGYDVNVHEAYIRHYRCVNYNIPPFKNPKARP